LKIPGQSTGAGKVSRIRGKVTEIPGQSTGAGKVPRIGGKLPVTAG
jgi:hypothetical protein